MPDVIIALGSNLGIASKTKEHFLSACLSLLNCDQIQIERIAPVYESSALGKANQGRYLNSILSVKTSLSPYALLRKIKQLEKKSGRRGYGRPWSTRTLDLDIVAYGKLVLNWDICRLRPYPVSHGHLILPHSQTHKRSFVLQPLADILPGWRHPVFNMTVVELNKRILNVNRFAGGDVIWAV